MRVKNKQTGEIGNITVIGDEYVVERNNGLPARYETLEDLCNKWGDYKEPEEYWLIDDLNLEPLKVERRMFTKSEIYHELIEKRIEKGNCFETKEEAELAVKKLQAWKRLKDAGFKFHSWIMPDNNVGKILIWADAIPGTQEDLDLLFSQEDDGEYD